MRFPFNNPAPAGNYPVTTGRVLTENDRRLIVEPYSGELLSIPAGLVYRRVP